MFIEKQAVTMEMLNQTLTNKFHSNTNIPVYISGDKETPHGEMVRVLDFVRRAGIQKVAFSVKATDSGGKP